MEEHKKSPVTEQGITQKEDNKMSTENKVEGIVVGEEVRRLDQGEIKPTSNWQSEFQKWQIATDPIWMKGFLHEGFGLPLGPCKPNEKEYDIIDRLIFYFVIADNWVDFFGNQSDKKQLNAIREQLARKAFNVLCLNFFNMESFDSGHTTPKWIWEGTVVSERLLPVIQNFFRVEEGQRDKKMIVRNLSIRDDGRSHNEQHAVGFLLNLARFLWTWKYSPCDLTGAKQKIIDERYARINAAKPWMIEVLAGLNRLEVLQKWMYKLDDSCLLKLKEIAMRHTVTDGLGHRQVTTLEEACYAGSSAAWFLKRHEIVAKEAGRVVYELINREEGH